MAFAVLIVPTILLGIISYTTSANSIKSIAMSTTEDTMMHASKYLGLLLKTLIHYACKSIRIKICRTILEQKRANNQEIMNM